MKGMSIQGVGSMCCAPPFDHVITGSYKKGSAHPAESEMYVCSLCNQSFSAQGRLKRHQESVHRQSAGFSCQVCSQCFYRKDHLGRYIKIHQPAVLLGDSAAFPTNAVGRHRRHLLLLPRSMERQLCENQKIQKTLKRHRQTVHR